MTLFRVVPCQTEDDINANGENTITSITIPPPIEVSSLSSISSDESSSSSSSYSCSYSLSDEVEIERISPKQQMQRPSSHESYTTKLSSGYYEISTSNSPMDVKRFGDGDARTYGNHTNRDSRTYHDDEDNSVTTYDASDNGDSYTYDGGGSQSGDIYSYGSEDDDDAKICHYGTEETDKTTYYYDDDYDCGMEVDTEEHMQEEYEGDDEILRRQVNKTNVSILVYKYVISHLLSSQNWGTNDWNDTRIDNNKQHECEENKGDDSDSTNTTTTNEHNISLLEEQVAIAIEAKALAHRQAVSIATRWKPRFRERYEEYMLDERRERNRLMLGGLKMGRTTI